MIVTVSGRDRDAHQSIFNQMFQWRYDVFVIKRRWTLPCKGTLEIDQYDNGNAVYFYHVDDAGAITSHVRLTPSVTDSLLADCYAHLVECDTPIRSPTVYEGTRYIVLPRHKSRACNRAAKAELLLAMIEWARDQGIAHIQVIIDITLLASMIEMTPQVRPMGLSRPYAGGPEIDGGGEAIAIRCPVNEQVIQDLRAYGQFDNADRAYRPLALEGRDTTVH